MPRRHGNVKNTRMYEGLRRKGMNKGRAARIANAGKQGARKGGKRSGQSRRP